ncbi:MAG: hypothetical protein EBS51_03495 [Planctomycetia bacterium]|nr:hypothetical protein [Planctomycetia bacterium]
MEPSHQPFASCARHHAIFSAVVVGRGPEAFGVAAGTLVSGAGSAGGSAAVSAAFSTGASSSTAGGAAGFVAAAFAPRAMARMSAVEGRDAPPAGFAAGVAAGLAAGLAAAGFGAGLAAGFAADVADASLAAGLAAGLGSGSVTIRSADGSMSYQPMLLNWSNSTRQRPFMLTVFTTPVVAAKRASSGMAESTTTYLSVHSALRRSIVSKIVGIGSTWSGNGRGLPASPSGRLWLGAEAPQNVIDRRAHRKEPPSTSSGLTPARCRPDRSSTSSGSSWGGRNPPTRAPGRA